MKRVFLSLLAFAGSMCITSTAYAQTVTQDTAQATNLGLYGGEVRYVAIDQTSDYVYAGTYSPNGIFISADNGATWSGVPDEQDFGEPRGVAVNGSGDLFVVADAAYKSTDHGTTFTELDGIGAYGGMLLYENSTLLVGRTDGAVSISTNDGDSFTTTTVEEGSIVLSLAASPTDGTFYAILDDNTTSTLYVTTDNGENWSVVDTSGTATQFGLVAVDPSNANHLYLTASGADIQPWHSTDGGETWTELDVTPYASKISFDSTGRIYFGVQYSDDNGATWQSLEPSTPTSRVSGIVVPDPDNDNVLFAGSFAALAKSTDQGNSWVDSNEGITAVTTKDVSQSTDKNTVWVATNAGLAKTTNFLDDEPTWEFPIYYDSYPESLWVSPDDANTVVVGGMGAIVKTTDGGETWATATGWDSELTAQQIISDPANPDVLYAAANVQDYQDVKTGDVYTSTDGGDTWESMGLLGFPAAQAIALASDGTLYAGIGNLQIRGDGATGIYSYADGTWTVLENAPADEITSILVDPSDSQILYATAANFNTYGADDDTTAGYYRSEDGGETWVRITEGLEDSSKFRAMAIQGTTSPTVLYLSGTNKLSGAGEIYKSADGGLTWGLYYTGLQNETFNTLLFDGLVAGNTRGLYGLQSFVNMKISAKPKKVVQDGKTIIKVVLTDAATHKKLKKRRVVLMRKVGAEDKFVRFKAAKTNKKGVVRFPATIQKKSVFKARFTPKRAMDREEFTKTVSAKLKVKVKK